MTKTRFY